MTTAYGRVSVMRRGSLVSVKNAHLQAACDLTTGLWSFSDSSGTSLVRDVGARWLQVDGKIRSTWADCRRSFLAEGVVSERFGDGARVIVTHRQPDDYASTDLILEVYSDSPFAILTLRVCNEGRRPFRVERLEVIRAPEREKAVGGIAFETDPSECFFFLNGSRQLARGALQIRKGAVYPADIADEPVSEGIVFDPKSQRAVTFGFLDGGLWWSGAQVGYQAAQEDEPDTHVINVWNVYQSCGGARCAPDETLSSERLYLNVGDSSAEGLRRFAETAAPLGDPIPTEPPSITVHLDVDDEESTAKRIQSLLGWFSNNANEFPIGPGRVSRLRLGGRWRGATNEAFHRHFPSGPRSVADQVHAAGLKLGAEIPTFLADQDIPDEFQDALIGGRNARKALFPSEGSDDLPAFDPTHPMTREWLKETFRRVCGEWGFDTVYTSLSPFRDLVEEDLPRFRWHEPYLTRMELLHRAFRLLMEAKAEVAPNATLGIADAPQSAAFARNFLSTAGLDRYYLRGGVLWDGPSGMRELLRAYTAKWYLNDARHQTEFGPLPLLQGRTNNESHLLLTIGLLTGGHLTLSDDLIALERDDLHLLAKCLPLTNTPARPIPMTNANLYAWARTIETPFGRWETLALVNLSDYFEDVQISFNAFGLSRAKDYVAYEFWDRIFYGSFQREFGVEALPPRSAKLFSIREEEPTPIFVASDLHVSQGETELLTVGWDKKSESIMGVCRGPKHGRGALFFYAPQGYVPIGASCLDAKYSFEWKPPVYELHLALEERPAPFCIRFARTSG